MIRDHRSKSRSEIQDRREHTREALETTEKHLHIISDDAETVRNVREELSGSETSEGLDAVEQSVDRAHDATATEFDRESGELDRVQSDGREFEAEIDDRKQSTDSDIQKVSDAKREIDTEATKDELRGTSDVLLQDKDFFESELAQSQEAIAQSEAHRQEQRQRLESMKRS